MVTDSAGVFSRSTEPYSKDCKPSHTKGRRQRERERSLSSTSQNSKRVEKEGRREGLEGLQFASRQIKSSPNLVVALPNLIFLHWIQYVLGVVGEGRDNALHYLFYSFENPIAQSTIV